MYLRFSTDSSMPFVMLSLPLQQYFAFPSQPGIMPSPTGSSEMPGVEWVYSFLESLLWEIQAHCVFDTHTSTKSGHDASAIMRSDNHRKVHLLLSIFPSFLLHNWFEEAFLASDPHVKVTPLFFSLFDWANTLTAWVYCTSLVHEILVLHSSLFAFLFRC